MGIDGAWSVWWVFPAAVGFATVALSTGISGALFFSPFFLLVAGLEPAQAIGAGLITELFGTSLATVNYARQRLVDYATVRVLLVVAVPSGALGAYVALRIEAGMLQVAFGAVLIALAAVMFWVNARRQEVASPRVILDESRGITHIRARDGAVYTYQTCNRTIGVPLAGVGAALTGLMSAGLPEITTTQLMLRCRIPGRVAVATSIMVLSVTVFFAAGIHALGGELAWRVVVWSVPGVIVGAQIGPRLQGAVPAKIAERFMAGVFAGVGVLVIAVRLTT